MNIETLKSILCQPKGKPFIILDDMTTPTRLVNNHVILAYSRSIDPYDTEETVAEAILREADWVAFYSIDTHHVATDENSPASERITLRFASGKFSDIGL